MIRFDEDSPQAGYLKMLHEQVGLLVYLAKFTL
jgi:hypothetical protein